MWQCTDGHDDNIFFWDGNTVTQITDNDYADRSPKISGNSVVWMGFHDGNDWEIFFWDGITVTQVTDNDSDDMYPAISKE